VEEAEAPSEHVRAKRRGTAYPYLHGSKQAPAAPTALHARGTKPHALPYRRLRSPAKRASLSRTLGLPSAVPHRDSRSGNEAAGLAQRRLSSPAVSAPRFRARKLGCRPSAPHRDSRSGNEASRLAGWRLRSPAERASLRGEKPRYPARRGKPSRLPPGSTGSKAVATTSEANPCAVAHQRGVCGSPRLSATRRKKPSVPSRNSTLAHVR